MNKKHLLLSLVTISLLSTGCTKQKCLGPNAHNGLYNALTCDYDANILSLRTQLSEKTIKRNKLFHNYQRLIALVTKQEGKLNQLNKEVTLIDEDLSSLNKLLTGIKNKQGKGTLLSIAKLQHKLKRLNMNILNKSTFFDLAEAKFTNKKLIETTDKQVYASAYNKNLLKDEKYASAYNKNLLKDEKYASAYHANPQTAFTQAYTKDLETDKNIRLSLSSKIQAISNSLSTDNIKNSETSLSNLVKEIGRYTDSTKS